VLCMTVVLGVVNGIFISAEKVTLVTDLKPAYNLIYF
jgi:hypothetical protein